MPPKNRNLIRKGLRQAFTIEISKANDDWENLERHHQIGMVRIGGRFKGRNEFSAIRSVLEAVGMCRLYVARRNGIFAGAY